jgi:hypothetical protein
MPSNLLLLLPLLGGYWFIHVFYYTKIRSQALDGYRLVFESVAAGIGFSSLAYIIILQIDRSFPQLQILWHELAPRIPHLASVLGGVALSVLTAYALNGMSSLFGRSAEKARQHAIIRYGNELQRLLQQASAEERLISVTLDNRKTYIGLVSFAPTLSPTSTYFSIIPFLSGYRHPETMQLLFTEDYLKVSEDNGLRLEDFRTVLPLGSVRMIAFFDPVTYKSFATGERMYSKSVSEQDNRQPDSRDMTVVSPGER